MSLNFVIPTKLEDLCAYDNTRYVIETDYNAKEVATLIEDCHEHLQQNGPEFILEDFAIFYGVLKHFSSLGEKVRDVAWKCIRRAASDLLDQLHDNLNETIGDEDISDKRRQCNVLKMIVYVLCSIIEAFESEVASRGQVLEADQAAKGRKKTKKSDEASDWDRAKESGIDVLQKLSSLSLHRLFTPPVVDEAFVNVMTKCCYKVIENPSTLKKESLRTNLFDVIGNAISKHKHSLNFCLKLIQMLQANDKVGQILSLLIKHVVQVHFQRGVIGDFVQEVERIDMNKDSTGTRAISIFLEELAENCTADIIPFLDTLRNYLDQDAYMMRNAVLVIIGKVISKGLTNEDDMDEDGRDYRDTLFEDLEDHLLDITTFTRSKAVQVLTRLCDEKKIPISRNEKVVSAIVGRLTDKSVMVRKYAVVFLTTFLKNNPFGIEIQLDALKSALDKAKRKCEQLKEAAAQAAEANQESNVEAPNAGEAGENDDMIVEDRPSSESESDSESPRKKKRSISPKKNVPINLEEIEEVAKGMFDGAEEDGPGFRDLWKQEFLVRFLSDAVNFAEQLNLAIPLVCSLLYSSSVTDAQVAIDFFVIAHQFHVKGAIVGIRKMIALIFSRDKSVKEAVLKAYKDIYINSPAMAKAHYRSRDVAIVNSLIELISGATLGELISLEELLKTLVADGDLGKDHTKVLFEKYSLKLPDTTEEDSVGAVQIIAMLAGSNRDIVRCNMETLISVGLGERADNNSQLVQHTCSALLQVADEKPKFDSTEVSFRKDKNHELFTRLRTILVSSIANTENDYWIPMCDEAVKVIYRLAENPDWICENLLRDAIKEILPCVEKSVCDFNKTLTDDNTDSDMDTADKTEEVEDYEIDSKLLTRLISLVGNVAFNQLRYMEINITSELKIRRIIKEEKESRKRSSMFPKTPSNRRSTMSARTPGGTEEEGIGLAGAAATEDVETDAIMSICNDEIVEKSGRTENLLAKLSSLIVSVAGDPGKYPDVSLRATATLSLAKYMAMSEKFCARHLRLMFTILEKSGDPLIRQNAIIALGDLSVRYPNLLDPWAPKLYSPLSDPDVSVRMNALKVLARLILSDMVKVKGQISEMAKIVVDDEESLAVYARFFFQELGKKDNAIYNVLPDIISNLSGGVEKMDEAKFQIVMKMLFDLIEKDRQAICLIEKLCQRFRSTLEEREWRDLSYCLNLLQYNDKSIAKLYENMICFADKLACDFVNDQITMIINAARKMPNIKQECKQMLDEFEKKMQECRSKGLEGIGDESEVQRVVGTPSANTPRKQGSGGGGRNATPVNKTKTKAKPKRRARRRNESDDEEEEFIEKEKPPPRASTRPTRERKRVQAIGFSSDEDSD